MDFSGLAFNSFGLGVPKFLRAQVTNQKLRPDGGPLGFVGFNWQGIGSGYRRIGYFCQGLAQNWHKLGDLPILVNSLVLVMDWQFLPIRV